MIKQIAISLAMLSVLSASAQKKWTLEECVYYALENNLTVKGAELDLENAEIDKRDAVGNFIPSLNGQISNQWNIGLTTDVLTGVLVNQTTMNTSVGANVNVNIFNGMQNLHQLRRANLAIIGRQYQLDGLEDNISIQVANAYLQILFNRESLKSLRAQNEGTRQNLARTRELVDNGALPEADIYEIEATAAGQIQQIVDSENALRLSKISLAQLLQLTDYENFDISDQDYDVPIATVLENNPKAIYEKSIEVVNNVRISETSLELAEYDLKMAKGNAFPSLSAFYGYNTRASDRDQISFDGAGNPIVSAPDPIFRQFSDNDGHAFGLSLNIPVFNGFSNSNNIKRREVALERAKNNLEQTKLDLETTVNQAYNDALGAYNAYEAAQKTLEARQISYRYTQERYDVGLMNSFELSQTQQRVEAAQADVIRTKYNYIFRLKILEFYFGIPITEI